MPTCQTCKATIVFVVWDGTGKAHPVDAAPVATGNLVIIAGLVRFATAEDVGDRYTSHFDTCPDRKEWRARGGKQLALF